MSIPMVSFGVLFSCLACKATLFTQCLIWLPGWDLSLQAMLALK